MAATAPGGEISVSLSPPSQRRSSAHILIGVLLQAPSHCLVTTPQMGTLPHVITITSSYSSIIPVAIAQQYSQSLPCCSSWIYSIAILCNHLLVWHQPRYARMQHVLMMMSRVKIKSIISKKNIYNTLTTGAPTAIWGEVAVSLPNLSVLVDVTAQCSFMNPSQRLLLVARCAAGARRKKLVAGSHQIRGVCWCAGCISQCVLPQPLKINPDMQPVNCG